MSQPEVVAERLSVHAWARLPEGRRGELVDGALVPEEMPDAAHEVIVLVLAGLLRSWLAGKGFVLLSGVKYALSPQRGRRPDLSVFFPGGEVPPRSGAIEQCPDIVVEVVSASAEDRRRDRVQKLREYAQFGVRYYWLVDPEARTLEVLELNDSSVYEHALDAYEGSVDIPGCSGLNVDLDALWAELDRLDSR